MRVTRRAALGSAIAALALPATAKAQTRRLDILSHRVHQQVLLQGAAGDLTAGWRRANQAELAWTTADIGRCKTGCCARPACPPAISAWATC
jgi:multiple sugar transport system substrate-binding protein